MANIKLGKKTYSGVNTVRMNNVDGGSTVFYLPENVPGTNYVVGTPITFSIPTSAWDGTHCDIIATGYRTGPNGLFIGLPDGGSTINTQRVVEAALTLPNSVFTEADFENNVAAYTTMTVSAVELPTDNIDIAVFGLKAVEIDECVTITDAAITGLRVPVTGELWQTSVDCAQYTGSVSWSPINYEDTSDTEFKASTVYTATVRLAPKPGYTIAGITADFFTVEGATSVKNELNSNTITVVFPATAAEEGT